MNKKHRNTNKHTNKNKMNQKIKNRTKNENDVKQFKLGRQNARNYVKQENEKTLEDIFYYIGAAAFFLSLFLAAVRAACPQVWESIRLPPCMFHSITGYDCPGCGGTRAVAALLHGHLLQSVCYHPLVVYAAAIYAVFMLTHTVARLSRQRFPIGMKYHNRYVWIALAILAVNFLLKNVLHFAAGFVFY